MDRFQKLSLLSENMDVEEGENISTSLSSCPEKTKIEKHPAITYAKMSGGKSIPLLKSVITSACERNCKYCAFRAGRDFRRETFKPDEMADTYLELFNKEIAKGLFLSSGIAGGGVATQDKIIDTAEILRKNRNYLGYMHLKIMPGAEYDQIFNLMKWADRVSINFEAPNPNRLSILAPKKKFGEELFTRIMWANQIRNFENPRLNWNHRWPSITTQFVVGPSGENDIEILKASEYLLQKFNLARIYYMTFSPVLGTPFENFPAENPVRGHRLYQASFLMRDYGFSFEDLSFNSNGLLPLDKDPKRSWADINLKIKPLEINKASKEELLRVPGIGPRRVELIAKYRGKQIIKTENDLKMLGIPIDTVTDYLLLNGKKLAHQLQIKF